MTSCQGEKKKEKKGREKSMKNNSLDFKCQWPEQECHTESPLASLVAQTMKNLPAMQESGILPLVGEDPLEKGMATHSNSLMEKGA